MARSLAIPAELKDHETGIWVYDDGKHWPRTFIDGIELFFYVGQVSRLDWLPYKNNLPSHLRDNFKTRRQWSLLGYKVKLGSVPYKMHCNETQNITHDYYSSNQVEK